MQHRSIIILPNSRMITNFSHIHFFFNKFRCGFMNSRERSNSSHGQMLKCSTCILILIFLIYSFGLVVCASPLIKVNHALLLKSTNSIHTVYSIKVTKWDSACRQCVECQHFKRGQYTEDNSCNIICRDEIKVVTELGENSLHTS